MAVQTQVPTTARAIMESGELRAVFQPIVDLADGESIGYEALARGPVGSHLEMPGPLFAMAVEEGILATFDQACRSRALAAALEAGLSGENLLFLNVEPAGLDIGGVIDGVAESGLAQISVVFEFTERALAARPSEVLSAVRWLRERNCRIALDDVGIDTRSLGLMPFLAPDVIKLDRKLTQGLQPESETARVLHAVRAEAERSGAVILAEGIETEAHLRRARAMGARLGQGWLFGRPGDLEIDQTRGKSHDGGPVAGTELPRRSPVIEGRETPFDRIADPGAVLDGDKHLLLSLSRQLEEEALAQGGESVVLATFQDDRFFTPATRRRYERIARDAALVGALGVGLADHPGIGVRGASLAPEDGLAGEWDVVVIGPHFAGAFVARDLGGDDGPDMERRFEYFMTYDRARVAEAARPLLRRLIRSQ